MEKEDQEIGKDLGLKKIGGLNKAVGLKNIEGFS
jgi:hypothetical protein